MSCYACNVSSIRSYALPRTSEGGGKLPRTVRVSYRLNGLPALPPPDAGAAREGAIPLDAQFPSIDGAPVCKCSPDARCDVLPMRRVSRCVRGFENADEAVRTSHDDVVWPRAARRLYVRQLSCPPRLTHQRRARPQVLRCAPCPHQTLKDPLPSIEMRNVRKKTRSACPATTSHGRVQLPNHASGTSAVDPRPHVDGMLVCKSSDARRGLALTAADGSQCMQTSSITSASATLSAGG